MYVHDEVLKLVDIGVKTGTGKKSGKPYAIPFVALGDDEYNRLSANLDESLLVDGQIPDALYELRGKSVVCVLEVVPKGFDLSMKVRKIAAME